MRLLITDLHFLPSNVDQRLSELALAADLHAEPTLPLNAERYTMAFGGSRFKEWGLEHFKHLRFIQLSMAGYNHLPTQDWLNHGLVLANAKDVFSEPMAEWIVYHILDVIKRGAEHRAQQAQRQWHRLVNQELTQQTAIFYGAGSIAAATARKLAAFGVFCVGVNSDGRAQAQFDACVSFRDSKAFLAKADIVIMSLPLNEHTRGAFDAGYVDAIKEGAIFLNVGRGHVVDETRLVQRLKAGSLAHAALDVFDQEPLPEDHPLWSLANVTITPHNSGTSQHTPERLWQLLVENSYNFVKQKAIKHRL
jgi:phosphoglycerate dehydrogenase-like enzyme